MGQALYRKYRSKSLSEIVGQKPVTSALTNALENGRISHAYLFTGPRGVGKTSVARILAYKINNIEYIDDNLPLDIIEIDAASNRRIDEIRDLREKVRIAPVSAKYKVYIIDEVHMLTREAFNALLKTLEEPPAHVVFILATTEAHKLPETIISRTQRYTFNLVSLTEVIEHLRYISNKENIDIDNESLELIAKHSEGSLRDALSLLDQIRHSAVKIEAPLVSQNLGLPSNELTENIINALIDGDPATIISLIQQARDGGVSANLIAEQLLQDIRGQIISGVSPLSTSTLIVLAQSLLDVETSNRPEIMLEVVLINTQLANQLTLNTAVSHAKFKKPGTKLTPSKLTSNPKNEPRPIKMQTDIPRVELKKVLQPITPEIWDLALEDIKKTHNTLYGVIRMAQPRYSTTINQFVLLFKFPFHLKRMGDIKNKTIVAKSLSSLGATDFELHFELMPKEERGIPPPFEPNIIESTTNSHLSINAVDQILNVFGGGEVLE